MIYERVACLIDFRNEQKTEQFFVNLSTITEAKFMPTNTIFTLPSFNNLLVYYKIMAIILSRRGIAEIFGRMLLSHQVSQLHSFCLKSIFYDLYNYIVGIYFLLVCSCVEVIDSDSRYIELKLENKLQQLIINNQMFIKFRKLHLKPTINYYYSKIMARTINILL